jgi:hypothetical protein
MQQVIAIPLPFSVLCSVVLLHGTIMFFGWSDWRSREISRIFGIVFPPDVLEKWEQPEPTLQKQ